MRPGAPEVTAIYFTRYAEPIPRGPARWTPSRWKLRIAWGKRGFHRISMVKSQILETNSENHGKSLYEIYEIYMKSIYEHLESV